MVLVLHLKAKELKDSFEEKVLQVMAEGCSHEDLWHELHVADDGEEHCKEGNSSGTRIEANLKRKERAREKATIDYNGDLK